MPNSASIIDNLLLGKNLPRAKAKHAFRHLFTSVADRETFGKALLVLLQKKGEHPEELRALVEFVRSKEKKYKAGRLPFLVDGCGTGGDGAHTFNVSTVSCLVAAGAGAQVAKHGNRSISSQCGSADLLRALGVKIDAPPSRMIRSLKRGGIGYFHAPLYHPMFRAVGPLRAELGRKRIKTIFNLTGPLLNPLKPNKQVIGVFRKDLVPVLAETARSLGIKRGLIVWNSEGLDELGISGRSLIVELNHGRFRKQNFMASSLGFKKAAPSSLAGGDVSRNVKIANKILSGREKGPKRDVVLLNAAAVLFASGKAKSIREGLKLARRSIDSGRAQNALNQLIRLSHVS